MPYILREWSLREKTDDPYLAPELRRHGLGGKIYGHPGFSDGSYVFTSSGAYADGRRVWTKSGSEYLLEGPPDEGYVKFLRENGLPPLDLDNPFGKKGILPKKGA